MTNEGYRPFSAATVRLTRHDGFASFQGVGRDYDPLGPGGYGAGCD